MIEELQAGSACDCTKNTSWKDKRLHCAVRRSLGKTPHVQLPQRSGTRRGAATMECHGSIECRGTDVEFVSCLMYSADLRAAAVPTATIADDRHAPERNVRNDEMSNWMWIDVGLVIFGDVGWRTASLVKDRRRWRKGQRRTKSASAR